MQTYAQQFTKQHDKLWDLYNKCYGDDSNDIFDELHDQLLYQVEGFNIPDDEVGEYEVKEITQLVNEVTAYYKAVTSAPQINWIYG